MESVGEKYGKGIVQYREWGDQNVVKLTKSGQNKCFNGTRENLKGERKTVENKLAKCVGWDGKILSSMVMVMTVNYDNINIS